MRYLWFLVMLSLIALWHMQCRPHKPGHDGSAGGYVQLGAATCTAGEPTDSGAHGASGASDRDEASGANNGATATVGAEDGSTDDGNGPTRVRIGTWNLRRLGHGDKRLDWAAQVIDHEFDVLALQEVMSEEGVAQLLEQLPGWTAEVSPKPVGTERYRELYAVLYRPHLARVRKSFTVRDRADELIREPFVVCMAVRSFDFCVVDVHIVFGDRASDRDAELHALGGQMARLRKRHDERDWLLLGDFNRQPRARGWKRLHAERFEFTLPGRVPTSLGKRGYASPYDHILVDARFTGELVGPSRRVDIVSTPCAGDVEVCRSQLSDHAPVVAVFQVDGPDDD